MTLAATVREAATRFEDTTAFVAAGGWTLSYRELDEISDRVAGLLVRHGVGAGDVVALVLPSTPDYIVAYAAAAKLGAITTGVNPRYTLHERLAVLAAAQPKLVIATDELAAGLRDDIAMILIEPANAVDELFAPLPPLETELPVLDDDPDRLVAIVFTSGTTGTPKGAMFGNRELAAVTSADTGTGQSLSGSPTERIPRNEESRRAPERTIWGGGGPMIAGTQFAHIGFMTKLPWYLQLGTTTYLLDRWRARDVLQLVHDYRMTSIGGVAPQVALMLRDPGFDEFDFSCVKAIIMGGALSPPALVQEARERFGAAYSIRYSSTESGGTGTGTAYDADDDEALFTVGRPRGDVRIEIRDDDDRTVAEGEVGEICLRSSAMMRGYWLDPIGTAQTLRDGWLHSGDLGFVDERGLLHMAGRKKEMYIRGGYNVYPVEVEAVLASHPAVRDIAIVPKPDDVLGEVGVAILVVRDGHDAPSCEELRAFGADQLTSYKLPEAVHVVPELPLTAMQKVDRAALRDHFTGPVGHT